MTLVSTTRKRLGLTLFLATLGLNALFAQQTIFTHLTSYEKRGDKLAYYFAYKSAVASYEQALKVDPEKVHLQLKIAECYRLLNNSVEAEKWYALTMAQPNLVKPEHTLNYALALNSNGKFAEAKKWYQQYQTEAATDTRGDRKIKMLDGLNSLFKDSISFRVSLTGLNTVQADFSPAFYKDGVVFVSNRTQYQAVKTVFSWNQSQFLDLYYTPESENGTYSNPAPFHTNVNTRLHEGPTAFYNEGTKMIFTRNNLIDGKQGKSKEGIVKLKLYTSELINGNWSKPAPLPFNNNEYSVGHPTVSADGHTLYFSSDKPGGKGGTDIYKATWSNNQWGEAENLGSEVNTEGNELFPFLHADNVLFFSSNGHGGLGGLDIFRYDPGSNSVENVGAPVNSIKDDFGLIASRDLHSGFFSSNRNGGAGDDDLYHFQEKMEIVEFIVFDRENGKVLENASVTIHDGKRNTGQYVTDASGTAVTSLNPNKNYRTEFTLTGYMPSTLELESKILMQDEPLVLRMPLMRQTDDELISGPVPDTLKTVLRLDGDGSIVENQNGNNNGNNNDKNTLTLIRLVNISGSVQDMLAERGNLFLFQPETSLMTDVSGKTHHALGNKLSTDSTTRKDEIFTALSKAGTSVRFYEIKNIIYYDYNRWNIRNDASSDLDKVVHLLLDFATVQVVLASHTDSRSTNQYNDWLSGKRADAAEEYMVNEGVEPGRITKTRFGETKLVNQCGDSVTCDEIAHQRNRRTEFTIQLKK